MEKQRIAYIDAMRGFTMILVVYSHICNYCLGDRWMGWNDVFYLFRLPCFFFISGWLFEKPERSWDGITIKSIIKHKFMVQIVPTVIFLLLLAPPPLFFSRLGATKGGYWFTFALFIFFVLHLLISKLIRHKQWVMFAVALTVSVVSFLYEAYYNSYFSHLGWFTKILGFLSFRVWRFYLFFYIGTLVKRHFEVFVQWTSKPFVIVSVIIGFIIISQIPQTNRILTYFIFVIGGALGLTMIFTLFRLFYTRRLSQITHHALEYIGTRTLDIYLLHYFLLPRFLLPYGEQLRAYHYTSLELVVALVLALIVVALCLVISRIIRFSPFLARYLFGVSNQIC